MTTTATESLAGQQADLLDQLLAVLAAHPAGEAFHLVYAAGTVPIAPGEILVQRVNSASGVLELHPTPVTDVTLDDVLHTTQVVRPGDPALGRAAVTASGMECSAGPNNQHAYIM